ncbi:hypothetical protein [Tenacibaculum xiamenense]|uniref:hypothetical protein n=1 Tax=Tenacibaculum xiamenense TaxID=1261553 RepID=UPI0038953635
MSNTTMSSKYYVLKDGNLSTEIDAGGGVFFKFSKESQSETTYLQAKLTSGSSSMMPYFTKKNNNSEVFNETLNSVFVNDKTYVDLQTSKTALNWAYQTLEVDIADRSNRQAWQVKIVIDSGTNYHIMILHFYN